MDVLEFGVEIGRRSQRLLRPDIFQLLYQLAQLLRYVLGKRTDLPDPGYIVVFLIGAGSLSILIAQGVLGSLSEKPLKLADQRLTQRFPLLKGVQHPVVGCDRILNLKE